MIVSLEAIFLSTFVLISQNRTDAKRQVVADQQWKTVQVEDTQNEELLDLSRQILELTKHVHSIAIALPGVVATDALAGRSAGLNRGLSSARRSGDRSPSRV